MRDRAPCAEPRIAGAHGWFQETKSRRCRRPKAASTRRADWSRRDIRLERVASQAIYRSDAVVRRAAALQAHPLTLGARIVLHPEDARRRGPRGRRASRRSRNGVGTAALPVAVSDRVARGLRLDRIGLRRDRAAGVRHASRCAAHDPLMLDVVDPFRDWLLSFGVIGLLVWIVLKILAIAVPVIIAVAFYVVWERKVIGWMHVRHGPMYVGRGIAAGLRRRVQAAVQGSDPAGAARSRSCTCWRR